MLARHIVTSTLIYGDGESSCQFPDALMHTTTVQSSHCIPTYLFPIAPRRICLSKMRIVLWTFIATLLTIGRNWKWFNKIDIFLQWNTTQQKAEMSSLEEYQNNYVRLNKPGLPSKQRVLSACFQLPFSNVENSGWPNNYRMQFLSCLRVRVVEGERLKNSTIIFCRWLICSLFWLWLWLYMFHICKSSSNWTLWISGAYFISTIP